MADVLITHTEQFSPVALNGRISEAAGWYEHARRFWPISYRR